MYFKRALALGLLDAQFTPARLFRAGEKGVWFDPSDFSTMFQDSAGTTPVTATGQPVGKILDKSGNAAHATQATAANRPVLQQDASGYYSLAFNGTNSSLKTAAIDFTGTSRMTVFGGYVENSHSAQQSLVSLGNFNGSTPGLFEVDAGGNSSIDAALLNGATYGYSAFSISAIGSKAVSTWAYDLTFATITAAATMRRNGSALTATAQGSYSAGTAFNNAALTIGARNGGASVWMNGNLYGLVVRGALSTSQQVAQSETWMNGRTGAY